MMTQPPESNLTHRPVTDGLLAAAVFAVALAIRVVNLGGFLTADEPRSWFGWSINFAQAMLEGRGGETFFNYTPGVSLMWLGSFGLYLDYLVNAGPAAGFKDFLYALPFDPIDPASIFWFRLPAILAASISVAIGFLLLRQLLGMKVAVTSMLLLAFDPLHIGMTRVLGNDGLVSSFILVSTLAIILFFISPPPRPYKKLVLSAVFAGLAILAKTTAVFMLPMAGLVALTVIIYRRQPKLVGPFILDGLLWAGIIVLTIILLFPALWFQPIDTLQNIASRLGGVIDEPHNRGSFFMGQPVPDPGLWFYWVITFLRLTLVNTVGLILSVGYLLSQKPSPLAQDTARRKWVIFLLWAFVVFFLIFLTLGSKKQDRYMTPVIPIINILAAAGYVWVVQRIKSVRWQAAALTGVVAAQALIALSSAPYYLTHYNRLAGGGATAQKSILVGWGEGLDQAAAWLNTLPDAANRRVTSWYFSNFEPFFVGQAIESAGGEKLSRSPKPALSADDVVLYINQIQRQMPTPGMIQFYQSFEPEHTVTLNGIDYAIIYPSPGVPHIFNGEVRLVGQAELLGYALLDAAGQPIEAAAPGSPATLQLYWEWQGKSPDEPIGLHVVDDAGNVWGRGHVLGTQARLPFEQWQEGMIARDDFALEIFPGTPPGKYRLKSWIDRPATGERVGDFPITEGMQVAVARPDAPPDPAELPLDSRLDAAQAGGAATLLGRQGDFSASWSTGERRDLSLYWHANKLSDSDQSLREDLLVTLQLVEQSGSEIRAGWSGTPAAGRFPTSQWQPGDVIRDPWQLELPAHVPPGSYRLTAQLDDSAAVEVARVTVEGRPRQFDVPPLDVELDVQFGDSIHLLGLQTGGGELAARPGQTLDFTLVWQASGLVDGDYTVTAQLLDGQGQVVAQQDGVPQDGAAPTGSWAAGEVVPDAVSLVVPDAVSPRDLTLLLIALYHPETGERLRLPNGADHLTIPVTGN